MGNSVPEYLLNKTQLDSFSINTGKSKLPFIEKTLKKIAVTIRLMYLQSEVTSENKITFIPQNPLKNFVTYIVTLIAGANGLKDNSKVLNWAE